MKQYLLQGYAINERIASQKFDELSQLVKVLGRTIQNQEKLTEDSRSLLNVVNVSLPRCSYGLGVLIYNDEIDSLLSNFNRYSGSDESYFLSLFSGTLPHPLSLLPSSFTTSEAVGILSPIIWYIIIVSCLITAKE